MYNTVQILWKTKQNIHRLCYLVQYHFMKQIKIQEGFDFPRPPLGTESGSPASYEPWVLGSPGLEWTIIKERREELECAALTSHSLPATPAWEEASETAQASPVPSPSAKCSPVPRAHGASISALFLGMPVVAPVGCMMDKSLLCLVPILFMLVRLLIAWFE